MMGNKMKEYLGNAYSDNHLKNFCMYWMKGRKTMPVWEDSEKGCSRYVAWRKKNDLDCLYFDGDLRADTLMSAWTPIKWVADCLNSECEMKFYKKAEDRDDPDHYLKQLAEDRDAYLPPRHELVQLLDCFLELAEERCNYILLPDRQMNSARYKTYINGKETWLFDEVPAMLYHIYQEDSLGRYFPGEDGLVDRKQVEAWISREHLEMGYYDKDYKDGSKIIPLVKGLKPCMAKWLTEENEVKEALQYMITFLEMRRRAQSCI